MASCISALTRPKIKTISGYFTYLEEERLSFRGRDIVYAVGVGIVDNFCCGVGGCRFVEVAGYIVSWKDEVDQIGNVMSKVHPIEGEEEKKGIRVILEKLYPHSQVNFG